ncbi:MAG: class I SAM-dependent methyltransferase [Clostridia bacterium]|nr:class I SAM-dependent methyltransferase [Clostridia bacterium]
MWIADGWKEYELIDCEGGERLERWGDYILVRPDPQVIWHGERKNPLWKKAHGVYKRQGGGGSWVVNKMPESWCIKYGDLTFRLRPMGFKHTGLFPEQATNWDWASSVIKNAAANGHKQPKVLNLFAYTGGATVACAKAGAALCHVDASKGMTQAAKENMQLTGLGEAPCRYIVDDCRKFVEREIRRGNRYDGVIMDPPSYGRGPNGEVWKLEECAADLIELVVKVLSDDPVFFLINSYTTGLSPAVMQYILQRALPENLKTRAKIETGETCIPVTDGGYLLPSGASVRVSFR